MKVVILCGGKGFRLYEETEFRPKPLVLLGGKPILWHIMKRYAMYGFKEFVFCLGYRGDMIKEYVLNYDAMNCDVTVKLGDKHDIKHEELHDAQDYKISLADTGLQTQTGGRVKRIKKYVGDETFMLTYGDGIANININELLKYHYSHGKIATITTVKPISKYGVLSIDDTGGVVGFSEKPIESDYISMGFFVFNKGIFDYLKDDSCVLEQEPLKELVTRGELKAYKHEGIFHSMDTYRDYIQLNEMWDKGLADWI